MTNANDTTNAHADDFGTLHDYLTGEEIRPATKGERDASLAAAERDGGAGVILVDDARCYVAD